jgi:hypothetical protein
MLVQDLGRAQLQDEAGLQVCQLLKLPPSLAHGSSFKASQVLLPCSISDLSCFSSPASNQRNDWF